LGTAGVPLNIGIVCLPGQS